VAELDGHGPGPTVAGGWETIRFAGLADSPVATWEGRSVSEIATAMGMSTGAVVVRAVMQTEGRACIIVDHGHLDNVRALTNGDGHLVGSDGIMGSDIPHPRATGTFLRFLAWAKAGLINVSPEEMVA